MLGTTDTTAPLPLPFGLLNGTGSNTVNFNSIGTFDLTAVSPDPAGGVFSNTLLSIKSGPSLPRLSVRR
jgi:hypothetical protein